jgi:hypothetical protein
MSLVSRYRRTTTLALGALVLTTATAGIASAAVVQTSGTVQAGADTTWCTIYSADVDVDGRTILTTPQIGPYPCGP